MYYTVTKDNSNVHNFIKFKIFGTGILQNLTIQLKIKN